MSCSGGTMLLVAAISLIAGGIVWVLIGGPKAEEANNRRFDALSPVEKYYDGKTMGGCTFEFVVAGIVAGILLTVLGKIFGC